MKSDKQKFVFDAVVFGRSFNAAQNQNATNDADTSCFWSSPR